MINSYISSRADGGREAVSRRFAGLSQRKKPAAIGVKAPFPGFIEPALATAIEKVPGGDRWTPRDQIRRLPGAGPPRQRGGQGLHPARQRLDQALPKIADDAWHVAAGSAIIDGEVVVPAKDGTTDFSVLQNELKGKSTKIVLVAFDLLYLNGYDLRKLPLVERKAHLKKIIDGTDIQFSESFEVDGSEMYRPRLQGRARRRRLQGPRQQLRLRPRQRLGEENLRAAGDAADRGLRLDGNDWDGIYVGRRKGSDLVYAGKVDHGFDKQSAADLRKRLTPLIRKTQPYSKRIAHKGIWVEPELLAEIEYRAKSAEGKVRHPFFKGPRDDL